MPNLGAIGSNTIFCEISLVTVPEAPISATPEDEGLRFVLCLIFGHCDGAGGGCCTLAAMDTLYLSLTIH